MSLVPSLPLFELALVLVRLDHVAQMSAYCGDGKHFVVRADEKLTASGLEAAIRGREKVRCEVNLSGSWNLRIARKRSVALGSISDPQNLRAIGASYQYLARTDVGHSG